MPLAELRRTDKLFYGSARTALRLFLLYEVYVSAGTPADLIGDAGKVLDKKCAGGGSR